MADIELVIKMPKEMWEKVKDGYIPLGISKYLKNGTLLPEGHGRLIDAEALAKKMCDREEEIGDDRAMWESSAVSVALDMFAPTIIEADESESEV